MAEKGIRFRAGGSGFKPGPELGASGRGCEALGCPRSSGMWRNRGGRGALGSGSSPGRLCRRGRPNSWWRRRSQQKWDLQELSSLGRLKRFLSSLTSRPPSRLGSLAPGPCCCSAWDFLLLRPCQSRNSPRPCSTSLCSSRGGISKASAAPPVPPSHLGACKLRVQARRSELAAPRARPWALGAQFLLQEQPRALSTAHTVFFSWVAGALAAGYRGCLPCQGSAGAQTSFSSSLITFSFGRSRCAAAEPWRSSLVLAAKGEQEFKSCHGCRGTT